MEKLINYVEIQAEKAENLSFCRGIKLLHIRDKVKEMLDLIGRDEIFKEYTVHNIEHVDEMLKIAEWLIPDNTKNEMTYAEWLMLTLAIYFHDLGMIVTKDEFDRREETEFKEYKERIVQDTKQSEYGEYLKTQEEKFLYQEFVRENHAIRIRQWIEGKANKNLGEAENVCKEIDDILKNLDKMFKVDLAMICESHHKDDIEDFAKYKVKKMYGNTDAEKVNLNYIAVILRISDLLHITRDRTPSITRRLININNPVSVVEWEKQMAVRAVGPKDQRNEEGIVDESKQKDTIEITAYFDGAETADAYFGLSAYLQYTRKELTKCSEIVEKAQKREGAVEYEFPWREIDESQIDVIGFEKKKLQFTIAQENILQLLVGHTLYNDSSVVVRELVQNGIDAVRLQLQYEKLEGNCITNGIVQVDWNAQSRELSFWDNGTGMSIQDVENYLLKVGASKYRDDSIRKQFPEFSSISHFGIGILTCFMIANDIDIITNSIEQDEANGISLRKVNGSYLLRKIDKINLDKRIRQHGTLVRLYVRNDVDMSTLEDDLRKWIVIPEIPVFLTFSEGEKYRIGYNSLKEILINYLIETGHSVDGKKYDVYEKEHGNVTVAYAVHYQTYMSEWCLMNVFGRSADTSLPIGTCIEGIRVEFSTPGYKEASILAIANIKNSKYKTNVARSAIELDANNKIISDIYDVYQEYVQEQMDKLEEQDYSQSWAMSEGRYLMDPLLYDNGYMSNSVRPINEDVLIQRLAKLKCLALENGETRQIVSAEQVAHLDEINIFDCGMTRAGEFLLKEIRSSSTLSSLISVVSPKDNFLRNIKNVICNIDVGNKLHKYALKNKEVSAIEVSYKQRRIHLTYSDKNNIWYEFILYHGRFPTTLFIPKQIFLITGLEDEIGVKTIGGKYIKSGTSLYQYVTKVIELLNVEKSKENEMLLELFLSYVFDSEVLETAYKQNVNVNRIFNQVLENKYGRVGNDLIEKLWKKISIEEFTDTVLTKNYLFYSVDNWSRSVT